MDLNTCLNKLELILELDQIRDEISKRKIQNKDDVKIDYGPFNH